MPPGGSLHHIPRPTERRSGPECTAGSPPPNPTPSRPAALSRPSCASATPVPDHPPEPTCAPGPRRVTRTCWRHLPRLPGELLDPDRPETVHPTVSRRIEADGRHPGHREGVPALRPGPIAHTRQPDLPPGLRRTLPAGDDDGAVNPGADGEPAVRTGREPGPGMVEAPRMAPNPVHDVRPGARHGAGFHPMDEATGDLLFHPPEKIPGRATRRPFAPHSVAAEDTTLPMTMKHALPEAAADVGEKYGFIDGPARGRSGLPPSACTASPLCQGRHVESRSTAGGRERSVQRGQRQPHPDRQFQIRGVVDR